jgi:hypothetical protein
MAAIDQLHTQDQYIAGYEFVRNEIYKAIQSFYTLIEVNNYAAENGSIAKCLNKEPTFWNLHLYALQTTFFVVLARIFDGEKDALSIRDLLAATEQHPEFFSKEALASRKQGKGEKPEWLDDYMSGVAEPTNLDLIAFKKQLAPFNKAIESVYRVIRSKNIAHNVQWTEAEKAVLFSKTNNKEIEDILYTLHDVMENLWQLIYNGRLPDFASGKMRYKDEIKAATRGVLDRLVSSSVKSAA